MKGVKAVFWKIRYALAIRRLCGVPLREGWNMAGCTLDDFGGDTRECSPEEAAEEERDEWLRCL
jgi:hypothetical protein